jgi:hypothetical protein
MKFFQWLAPAVIFAAVSLLACSGEGLSRVEGDQCPEPYDPFPITASGGQTKVSPKPEDLLPGNYAYERADIYYVDNSGFRMQMMDTPSGDNQWKGNVTCVRNASEAPQGMAFSLQGISGMKTDALNKTADTLVRNYDFHMGDDGKYIFNFTDGGNQDSPGKVMPIDDPNYIFIKDSDTAYEIRMTKQTATGQYWIRIQLSYKADGTP